MSTQNYSILFTKHSGGQRVFLFEDSVSYVRTASVMPATFDFNADGQLIRIEILYLQHELYELNQSITAESASGDADTVLQVGDPGPLSFVLWMKWIAEKSHTHAIGDAWVLVDGLGKVVGVETILTQ